MNPKAGSTTLHRFLHEVVIGGHGYTAAAARVERAGVVAAEATADDGSDGIAAASLFDLASLTKPFVATLAAQLDAAGRLPLDLPVGEVLPEAHRGLARRSLDDLLRHRSGLRPWAPLYARASGRRRFGPDPLASVLRDPRWWGARRGTYSDLGYLVYGRAAERANGSALESLLARWLLEPLTARARTGSFAVQPGRRPDVVPCRLGTGREVQLATALGVRVGDLGAPLVGRAQDGNARFLGGLPGHAGLFADLATVTALGREWLRPGAASVIGSVARSRALDGGGPFACGWRRRSVRGSAGDALDASGFGHDGFTGGSLWIDPRADLLLVLLGHRTDAFLDLRPLRRAFHRLGRRLGSEPE